MLDRGVWSRVRGGAFALMIAVLWSHGFASSSAAQDGPAGTDRVAGPLGPLEALGDLIVGTWEADDAKHTIEWGVGRRLIRARSHFLVDAEWQLVSEGLYYWDLEEEQLRGLHFAVGMPVDRFEQLVTVGKGEVVYDVTAHGESVDRYIETWTFDDEGYRWRLEQPTPDGLEEVMGGSYRRGG